MGDLHFRPSAWGDRVVRIAAPGGVSLLIRRHGAPELPLWIPAELEPVSGKPFGLYLHPDRQHSERVRAAETFRRVIGLGAPLHVPPNPHAHRLAAMLYIYDLQSNGASLRDIAGQLLDPLPDDWRLSSERSDLRRLADAAAELVSGGYRRLLGARPEA
ncbi:hypothetical protein FHW96_001146 [Novosphingobium sp. SG751A]|uniref:DUF2285 domain-containing protein n=1 Tax=Novosphingobium sp. SG751A TaxID=2587000 RepID=UPI00155702F7|nr:DUF2285 domain-containing protein [Novosphingobium sp. SG751A]NOW45000.1 hypothetical protein [Novosphingobium sp. SG751A]